MASEPDSDPTDDTPKPRPAARGQSRLPVLIASVLLAVMVVCAGVFGVLWFVAAHNGSLNFSADRDRALQQGEQAIANINTLDYHNVDQGLNAWKASATGDLLSQLNSDPSKLVQEVQAGKTVTRAKVVDGALTELDDRAGKATIMVAMEVTVTPDQGQPAQKHLSYLGTLIRTGDGWKLSNVQQVPLGTAGQ